MMQSKVTADLFSVEAEQQLLGAVLTNNDRYHDVSSFLRSEHFHDPVHADIWRNIAGRIERDHIVSPVTLQADLSAHEGIIALGGARYLARLAGASVAGFAVRDYAKIIVDLHDRKTLADSLAKIEEGIRSGRNAEDTAAELELMLHNRAASSDDPRTMSFLKAQTAALTQMNEIYMGGTLGVPTGLKKLDEVLSLAPGRYTILGGSTSMGKTALALYLSHFAASVGYGVGFASLEMPETDLANRINSIVSQIPYKAYDRVMSESLFRRAIEAGKALETLPIEIFSERVRDVPAILSEGKKLRRKMQPSGDFHGLKLLVVDYVQLVRGRGESALVRLSQVANDLKQVAKQLDVHVLALAQVDRKLSDDVDARPTLSALRGSGDLEMAPDNVIFIHRPEYFFERAKAPTDHGDRADFEGEWGHWKGKAEIIIAKARMGEITSVTVGCDMATNRFFDLEKQEDMAI